VFKSTAGLATLRQPRAQVAGEGSLKDGVDILQPATITLTQSAAEGFAPPPGIQKARRSTTPWRVDPALRHLKACKTMTQRPSTDQPVIEGIAA
jgi:hypothetical protein